MRPGTKAVLFPFWDGSIFNISPRQDPAAEGLAQPITTEQIHCGCTVTVCSYMQGQPYLWG